LFKETKNRFKSVCQKVLRTGILFASLAGLLLVPSLASAANLNANGGITITTALEVDGKPENLVRMVKNQPAQVTVIVTISELKTKEGGTVQQLKLGPSGSGADTLVYDIKPLAKGGELAFGKNDGSRSVPGAAAQPTFVPNVAQPRVSSGPLPK
jgi:hypothetical protein